MKILHTSDWHLGIRMHNRGLLEAQSRFLDKLFFIAGDEAVDAVIVAGDVFHRAIAGSEAIELYNRAISQLCVRMGLPVLICAGNHDSGARLAVCRDVLARSGLYVRGKISRDMSPVIIGDSAFHLLPFFNIDEVRAICPEDEINDCGDAFRAIARRMPRSGSRRDILIAHCFVRGGQTSESDRTACLGGAELVPPDAFEGFDYVALGHLHRAQNVGKNIRYSGSPIKYSFAECGHDKSVTIIDTEDMTVKEVVLEQDTDMRVISGCLDRLLDNAAGDERREDYIRLEISDAVVTAEIVEMFRGFYPNLLQVVGLRLESDQSVTLTVEQVGGLSDDEILDMFCRDILGAPPGSAELEYFRRARNAVMEAES